MIDKFDQFASFPSNSNSLSLAEQTVIKTLRSSFTFHMQRCIFFTEGHKKYLYLYHAKMQQQLMSQHFTPSEHHTSYMMMMKRVKKNHSCQFHPSSYIILLLPLSTVQYVHRRLSYYVRLLYIIWGKSFLKVKILKDLKAKKKC
jgi:hypothetical protein